MPIAVWIAYQSLSLTCPVRTSCRLMQRLRAQHALDELVGPHLKREDRDRRAVTGGVDAHVERERGLSHGRSRREDAQVAGMKPREQLVEVLEAGVDAGDVLLALGELLEVLERHLEQIVDDGEVAADPLVGDVEDQLLGVPDHLVQVVGRVVAHRGDGRARHDELPEHRHPLDDVGVALPVRRDGDNARDVEQVGSAAGGVEFACGLEAIGDGEVIDRHRSRVQVAHRRVDPRVRGTVEVLRLQDHQRAFDRLGREEHRAENRLLRLDAVGRFTLNSALALPADRINHRVVAPCQLPRPSPAS